mmetsp:Transcript_120292/g.347642  ORF Transcript_120292/g.347642 Transcript_120292/m.347642 type:complete len:361 (-) Transcript_120292:150-1232(-)
MAEEASSETGDSEADSTRLISRRERKNAKARERAALTAERVEEIRAKPPEVRTREESALLEKFELRRSRRNERSRERAEDKRKEIERILAVPAKERSAKEIEFLSKALDAKERKNQGDRSRRQKLRSLGVPARMGLKKAADQGLLSTEEAGQKLGLKIKKYLDPWSQSKGPSQPALPSLDEDKEFNVNTFTPTAEGGENWEQPSGLASLPQATRVPSVLPSTAQGALPQGNVFSELAYRFSGMPPVLPMHGMPAGLMAPGVTPTTQPFAASPPIYPQFYGLPMGMGYVQASPANLAGGFGSAMFDMRGRGSADASQRTLQSPTSNATTQTNQANQEEELDKSREKCSEEANKDDSKDASK